MRNFLTLILAIWLGSAAAGEAKTIPWPAKPLKGANVSTGITKDDLHHFASVWKGQVVRVLHLGPIQGQAPYAIDEKILQEMITTSELALAEGLAVVFAPGVAMDNNDLFFRERTYQQSLIRLWKRVADHFKNDKRLIAYDLMNEPHDELANKKWSPLAKELTREIRAIDAVHPLIVEPPEWGWPQGFQFLEPTGDTNTVYSFHFYGPNDFTHQRTARGGLTADEKEWKERRYPGSKMEGEVWNRELLERKLEAVWTFKKKHHVTVWCGEFGTARWALGAKDWLSDMTSIFKKQGAGWAYYSYREWQAMDIEMSPDIRNQKTPRSENALVQFMKNAFAD